MKYTASVLFVSKYLLRIYYTTYIWLSSIKKHTVKYDAVHFFMKYSYSSLLIFFNSEWTSTLLNPCKLT